MKDNLEQTKSLQFYSNACLSYLISEPNELLTFMEFAGYQPQSLRQAMGSKALELALMEYFAKNEAQLLAMCANNNIDIKQFINFWQKQSQHL